VFCEGHDEYFFFMWFLDYFKKQGCSQFETVQLIDSGGINQLSECIQTWRLSPGFQNINALAVIRDAETDANAAIQSIQDSLQRNNLLSPQTCFQVMRAQGEVSVAFALLPGKCINGQFVNGTLEDLCLEILDGDNITEKMVENEDYLNQFSQKFQLEMPRLHKAKLHTYFAEHDKYVGLKPGEAARVGAFDFESDLLVPFKAMFLELTE